MVLLVASTLGLSSCGKKQEKRERPPKLDIVSVDKFTGSLLGDCAVTLTLANNTAMKITINSGELSVKHNGKKIGHVITREGFVLPPRKQTQITLPLRITLANSMSTLSAVNSIRQGILANISVDYTVTGKVMASKFTIGEKDITLEQIKKDLELEFKK